MGWRDAAIVDERRPEGGWRSAEVVEPEQPEGGVRYQGFWNELGKAAAQSSYNVGAGLFGAIGGGTAMPGRGVQPIPEGSEDPLAFARAVKGLQEAKIAEKAGQIRQAGQEKFPAGEGGGWKGFVAQAVGQAVPYMGAAILGTAAIGPAGGFVVGYSVEGNDAYFRAKELGASEDDARFNGFMTGTINGAIESLQVSGVVNFGKYGKGAVRQIAEAARQRAWSKLAKETGKLTLKQVQHAIQEGLEETVQEAVSIAGEQRVSGEPLNVPEAGKRVGMAGLGGAAAGTAFGLLGLGAGGGGQQQATSGQRPATSGQMRQALRQWDRTEGAVQEQERQAAEERIDAEDAALAREYEDILIKSTKYEVQSTKEAETAATGGQAQATPQAVGQTEVERGEGWRGAEIVEPEATEQEKPQISQITQKEREDTEAIRSDTGRTVEEGIQQREGETIGGENIQRPEEAGAKAGGAAQREEMKLPMPKDVSIQKQKGGFYKMYHKGRKTEVFPGERFTSAAQARAWHRNELLKEGVWEEESEEDKAERKEKRRISAAAKETAQRILDNDLYKQSAEQVEKEQRHFTRGPFYISEKERAEVEHIVGPITGRPGDTKAAKMFTFEKGQGTPWDVAVMQYVGEGRSGDVVHEEAYQWDIDRFAQMVKDAVEGQDSRGVSGRALEGAETTGEPYVQYLAERYRMLAAGASAQDVDKYTTDWAESVGATAEEMADDWIGDAPKRLSEIEKITDPAKQEEALTALAESNSRGRGAGEGGACGERGTEGQRT